MEIPETRIVVVEVVQQVIVEIPETVVENGERQVLVLPESQFKRRMP